MSKFRLVLSERGKKVFKGGNVEVMKKNLRTYDSLKTIENRFLEIGTSNYDLYEIEEIRIE